MRWRTPENPSSSASSQAGCGMTWPRTSVHLAMLRRYSRKKVAAKACILSSISFAMALASTAAADAAREWSESLTSYDVKVGLESSSATFAAGWIAIFDKKTRKELARVTSDALYRETETARQLVAEGDFNFDGRADVAVMDGQKSCYGGPSFQVFLATRSGSLRKSDALTRLAQEYCGLFQVDAKAKRLLTSGKGGCCWHEFSVFAMRGETPVAERVVTEDAMHEAEPSFEYTPGPRASVLFRNENATYVIRQSGQGKSATIEIAVTTPTKSRVIEGQAESLDGGLERLSNVKVSNMRTR
jgi:hypothetical protein